MDPPPTSPPVPLQFVLYVLGWILLPKGLLVWAFQVWLRRHRTLLTMDDVWALRAEYTLSGLFFLWFIWRGSG